MVDIEDEYVLSIQVYDEFGLYKNVEYACRLTYKEVEKRFIFFKWKKLYKVFDEKESRRIAQDIALKYIGKFKKVRIMKNWYSNFSNKWIESEVIWENGEWK